MNVTPEPRTCGQSGGIAKNGSPCAMNVPDGTPLCPHHDPAMAEEMTRRRLKGNASRTLVATTAKAALVHGVPDAPQTLEDAVQWSSWAMHAVATGALDARVGHEIGYLVNAFKAAVEKRDLLREIAQLRADLAAARRDVPTTVLGLHRG